MKPLVTLATLIGMCQRAHAKCMNPDLPKDQRDFHAGRREAYLKCIAILSDASVKEIRPGVLGSTQTDTSFLGQWLSATSLLGRGHDE